MQANHGFHDVIYRVADLPYIEQVAKSARRTFAGPAVWAPGDETIDELYLANEHQHAAIHAALAAGSPEGARALAREHVLASFGLLETILEQVGRALATRFPPAAAGPPELRGGPFPREPGSYGSLRQLLGSVPSLGPVHPGTGRLERWWKMRRSLSRLVALGALATALVALGAGGAAATHGQAPFPRLGFRASRELQRPAAGPAVSVSASAGQDSASPGPACASAAVRRIRHGPGRRRGGPRRRRPHPAATFLNDSVSTLETDLAGGKTLAQEATAKGKTAADLITAIVEAQTAVFDTEKAAGWITADQETALVTGFTNTVTDLVNNGPPVPPGGQVGPGGTTGGPLQLAATYLGISVSDLQQDLRAARSSPTSSARSAARRSPASSRRWRPGEDEARRGGDRRDDHAGAGDGDPGADDDAADRLRQHEAGHASVIVEHEHRPSRASSASSRCERTASGCSARRPRIRQRGRA